MRVSKEIAIDISFNFTLWGFYSLTMDYSNIKNVGVNSFILILPFIYMILKKGLKNYDSNTGKIFLLNGVIYFILAFSTLIMAIEMVTKPQLGIGIFAIEVSTKFLVYSMLITGTYPLVDLYY